MAERQPRGRRRTSASTQVPVVVRLHERDIDRIVTAVVTAIRRERMVDDIARSIRERLRELNDESKARDEPHDPP